jgi:hypothetical protein
VQSLVNSTDVLSHAAVLIFRIAVHYINWYINKMAHHQIGTSPNFQIHIDAPFFLPPVNNSPAQIITFSPESIILARKKIE